MTFREVVAEDNVKKEIQFLQYDNLLQVITAIAGHVTTLKKIRIREFYSVSLLVKCKQQLQHQNLEYSIELPHTAVHVV